MNEEPPLPADRTFRGGGLALAAWVLRDWCLNAAHAGAWVPRRCPQISGAARRGAGFTPLPAWRNACTVAALRFPGISCPPIAPHPRKRLACPATGGASPLSPFSFVLAKDKVNCPEGKRGAPGGKRAAPGTKENRLFSRLLVRPVKTGLVSSSCAEPLDLSVRSRRSCDIGCKSEGAKRTRGPSCAAAARPGIRRRFLPAGAYTLFFCPLSGSGAVAESSPICTNRLFETRQMRPKRSGRAGQ